MEHGFAEQPDGTVTLKCAPGDEAKVFEARARPPSRRCRRWTPVVIARGGRDGEFGPAAFAGAVAEAMPGGSLRAYPHVGHFGPFQDPDTFADDAIAHFLQN